MTVAATVTALQTIHAAISGVNTAPPAMPSNLNTATMPIVLTMPGPGTWRPQAIDLLIRCERTYTVRCYVGPVGQDKAGPENAIAAISPMLDAFGQAYLADITLGGAVDTITSITDTGVTTLQWAGIDHWGFEFSLNIVEKTAA